MKELATLNKYFLQYRWRLILGILFVLISNYFKVLQPQEVKKAMDYVQQVIYERKYPEVVVGQNFMKDIQKAHPEYSPKQAVLALNEKMTSAEAPVKIEEIKKLNETEGNSRIQWALVWFGGIILLYALLMGVFMYFMRQTIIVMSRLIEYDMRNEIFAQYEKLNLSFYKQNKTGDLMARITEDVNKVRMYVGPAILYASNLVGSFILTLWAMLHESPTLTLYTLLPLPVLSVSIYYISKMINKRSERVQAQLSVLNSTAQEVFSGIRVIKSYVQEKAQSSFFAKETEEYRQRSLSLARINALFFPMMILLIGMSIMLTLFVGGILIMRGEATPGSIGEFVIFVTQLTWPFTAIGWIASIAQTASASQKRINQFMSIEPKIAYDESVPSKKLEGNIVFDKVSFVYPDTGIKALEQVSFDIKAGEKVAIIGRTGSGKSTLADLLVRMYDINYGQILIDGQNIKSWNLANLRRSIGYVPQDVFLFSDTVSGNIALGNPGSTQEEIEKYARYAAVYDDILDLEKGFQTVVGERGVTLSGGQKQRISIARALIKKPSMIVLDDCLSAVDAETEQQIASFLQEVCADATTFIITHRIYQAVKFDKIIVLDNGRMVEYGSPEQVYAQKGYYYEMLEHQSGANQIVA